SLPPATSIRSKTNPSDDCASPFAEAEASVTCPRTLLPLGTSAPSPFRRVAVVAPTTASPGLAFFESSALESRTGTTACAASGASDAAAWFGGAAAGCRAQSEVARHRMAGRTSQRFIFVYSGDSEKQKVYCGTMCAVARNF